jgi:hypothetical protein
MRPSRGRALAGAAIADIVAASHHASTGTQENVIFFGDGRNAWDGEEARPDAGDHFARSGCHICRHLFYRRVCHCVCHALYLDLPLAGLEAAALGAAVDLYTHLKVVGDLSPS